MPTNIIGTDARTIGMKVKWFRNIITSSISDGKLKNFTVRDAIAVAEMITMVNESTSCRHTTTRTRNPHGYERPPSDWNEIPTMVEQMTTNFVGDVRSRVSMRVNEIISTALCDMMCMIDVAMAYFDGESGGMDLVCLNVTSGRHMAVTKLIFDLMCRTVFVGKNVYLHMFVSTDIYTVMVNVLNDNPSVVPHMSTDWYTDMNMVRSINGNRSITVMMNGASTPTDVTNLLETPNVMVSAVAHMNDPMMSTALSKLVTDKSMVMEMALLSDPSMSTVRIRNATWSRHSNRHTTMYRLAPEYTGSLVSSITHRIRPMNLDRMCYDCRMVHEIVKTVAYVVKDKDVRLEGDETRHWSEDFHEHIYLDETDYEAPI